MPAQNNTEKVTALPEGTIWRVTGVKSVNTRFGEAQVMDITNQENETEKRQIWGNTKLATHAPHVPFMFRCGVAKTFINSEGNTIEYKEIDIIN